MVESTVNRSETRHCRNKNETALPYDLLRDPLIPSHIRWCISSEQKCGDGCHECKTTGNIATQYRCRHVERMLVEGRQCVESRVVPEEVRGSCAEFKEIGSEQHRLLRWSNSEGLYMNENHLLVAVLFQKREEFLSIGGNGEHETIFRLQLLPLIFHEGGKRFSVHEENVHIEPIG